MSHDPDTIESLARALYNISGIRRDLRRRAGIEHAIIGLTALGAIQRIGPARVSDIAAELQVDLSVASRQVHALADDGLIVRVPDPRDGRSSLIELSPAGLEKLGRVHVRMTDALQGALADWDPDTLGALVDGLTRLRADLAIPAACAPADASPGAPASAAAPTTPSRPVDGADAPAASPVPDTLRTASGPHQEHHA